MIAGFLHFYPQYSLDDLRRMHVGEFYFLMAGMLDIEDPERTDPVAELVQKRLLKMTLRERGRR